MKPKLLISLGCSWTEGVGCYDPPISYDPLHELSKDEIEYQVLNHYVNNRDRFHEMGWPNKVAKRLGFDKVINLGVGGSSNSAHLKILYEFVEDNDISEYDVLIIWLMTEPVRFSFYINGRIKNFQKHYIDFYQTKSTLMDEYIKEIGDINLDPVLEHKFYLKTLENFCTSHNIDLITTSWNPAYRFLFKLYDSKTYLHKSPRLMKPPKDIDDSGNLKNYSFCRHPNENGYDWISNEIVNGIRNNHPKWYSDTINENIECIWNGDPRLNTLNNIL